MPEVIDAVQSVMADVAKAVENVDTAINILNTLSFGLLDINVGDQLSAVSTPTAQMATSLSNLSGDVQQLERDLKRIAESLAPLARDALALSSDMTTLNDDLQGFADRVVELLDNEELYQKFQENCIARSDVFSIENTVSKWYKRYTLVKS